MSPASSTATTGSTSQRTVATSGAGSKRARPADEEATPDDEVTSGKRAKASPKSSTTAPSKAVDNNVDVDDEGNSEHEREESDKEDTEEPLAGKFDLYNMDLSFLKSKYLPDGTKAVNPEALYHEILKYQAKNDRTAKITIPTSYTSSLSDEGTFRSGIFCDPFEDMPFDVVISDISVHDDIKFKSKFASPATGQWKGPGIKGSLEIEDGGGCGIASSSGKIAMHPMWKAKGKDGTMMELFEGTFTFQVKYSGLYSRKGHGSGIPKLTIPFWGVRGL